MTPIEMTPKKPDELDKLKILVYGEPGAGKTVLAGSAQDCKSMKNALMISVEAGTLSIRDRDIDVLDPDSIREFRNIFDWIASHARFRQQFEDSGYEDDDALDNLKMLHKDLFKEETDEPKLFRTVIIDNLTEVNTLASDEVLDVDKDSIVLDPPIERRRDWGKIKKMVGKIVRDFKNLPIHTIITAHKTKDGDEPDSKFKPAVTGNLKDELPGFFDVVGILQPVQEEDENGESIINRYFSVEGSDRFIAKDRSDSLGTTMINPTMSDIMSKIE